MKSTAEPMERTLKGNAGQVQSSVVVFLLLAGIALLAGANVYTLLQLDSFREEVGAQFATHEERLSLLDGSVSRTSESLEERVAEVTSLVESTAESTQERIDVQTRQVEARVLDRTEDLEREIETARQESEAKISEVGGKLEQTTSQVGELGGEVDTVKVAVEENRSELEKAVAELTSVKGDLGVQSGLIATNADELAALKELGERNYYEFNLGRTRNAQRVGPVSIRLTGTDRKRNRYSIELWADDKKIVKRRKTLLEPVQFYVEGARTPYELVVNKIDSGLIEGYLATPKGSARGA